MHIIIEKLFLAVSKFVLNSPLTTELYFDHYNNKDKEKLQLKTHMLINITMQLSNWSTLLIPLLYI